MVESLLIIFLVQPKNSGNIDMMSRGVFMRDNFIVTYLALSPWSEVTVLSDLLDLSYFLNKIR